MRPRYLIPIMLILTMTLNATGQELKGKMLVGGNLSFSGRTESSPTRDSKNFSFLVRPIFGGFISNSVAMGAMVSYNYYNSNSESTLFNGPSESHTVRNVFGFAYFIRYYKFFGKKFSILLTGNVAGSRGIENYDYTSSSNSTRSKYLIWASSISFSPGIVYFINPKFGLETSFGTIGLNIQTSEDELSTSNNKSTQSNYILDFGLTSLQFGVNYYFGKGKAKKPLEE